MSPNPKSHTFRSKAYLAFIASLPCAVCGAEPTVPHHERFGKGGTGIKPPDSHCIPLCFGCHTQRHAEGVETFWAAFDPKMLCIEYLTRHLETKGL